MSGKHVKLQNSQGRKSINILALAINFKGFTVDTLYREQMALRKALHNAGDSITFYGPGFEYETNDISSVIEKLSKEGRRPDLIISYISENHFFSPLPVSIQNKYSLSGNLKMFPRNLNKITGIPKVMWGNDFWHMSHEDWDGTILGHGFQYVISTYCPPFVHESDFQATYSETLRKNVRFIPIPRGIDANLFCDYKEDRTVDVTLLGAMGDFYPLRQYFHQSLSSQSWINYFTRSHPGYDFNSKEGLYGEAYARALSRSKIFVSCTGRYNLPFIKIYEALASGTLLMCDKPCGAEKLGLVDGVTYVEVNQLNFMQKLKYYLNHPEELARVAKAGQNLFYDQYTVEHNATRLVAAFREIIKEQHLLATREDGADSAVVAGQKNINVNNNSKGYFCVSNSMSNKRPIPSAPLWDRLKAASKRLMKIVPDARTSLPANDIPFWEEVKVGTCLDWTRVVEVRHVLEISQIRSMRELKLVEKYGLNSSQGARPVITQHPETVCARPKVLQLLAQAHDAKVLCEIGTARGLQSFFWAEYLSQTHTEDGSIFTCDIIGHDEPVFHTPMTGQVRWTRRELWDDEPVTSKIHFVHGTSKKLREELKCSLGQSGSIDVLYVDAIHDEESVLSDYENLRDFIADETVLIFDDCDPRFPGVESAVNKIATERNDCIRLLTFWPSPYMVAILGSSKHLDSLSSMG